MVQSEQLWQNLIYSCLFYIVDGDKSDPESPPFLEMTVKLSPDKNAMEVIKLCVYRREKSSGNKNKQNGVIGN